jgi:hypothetical protein
MEGTRASRGGRRLCRESPLYLLDSEHRRDRLKQEGNPALFGSLFRILFYDPMAENPANPMSGY